MNTGNSQKIGLRQRAAEEFKEIAAVFFFLAFFFCAITTYRMLLVDKFQISYFGYGAALINAFVITKVILIGEAAHFGKELEAKPLLYSAIYKAVLFSLLVFVFHMVEEIIKRVVTGKDVAGAFHQLHLDEMLARSVIVFCTFIPLFLFRELGRVLGRDKLRTVLLGTGAAPESNEPTEEQLKVDS
jgi:hypothetical protein